MTAAETLKATGQKMEINTVSGRTEKRLFLTTLKHMLYIPYGVMLSTENEEKSSII